MMRIDKSRLWLICKIRLLSFDKMNNIAMIGAEATKRTVMESKGNQKMSNLIWTAEESRIIQSEKNSLDGVLLLLNTMGESGVTKLQSIIVYLQGKEGESNDNTLQCLEVYKVALDQYLTSKGNMEEIYIPSANGHDWLGAYADNLKSDVALELEINTNVNIAPVASTLWRLNTLSARSNHYSDVATLDEVLGMSSAAQQCLTNKGYTFDDSRGIYTSGCDWIALSVVLADEPEHTSSAMVAFGGMDQSAYMPCGESNQIRNALVHDLGYSSDKAGSAIISWRKLDNGAYGWVADIDNGTSIYSSFYWADGAFVQSESRAKFTQDQVRELMLQIDCFCDVVNSAFDDNDLDRVELASVWAIGLTKLIG